MYIDMSKLYISISATIIILILLLFKQTAASKIENQLYRDILNNYSKLVRPVRNSSQALNVEMKVFLQQIMGLDGKDQIIELNAWLKYIWIDYRLAWDSAKYGGITSIRFAGGENQIWRPDVLLYNSASEEYDSTFKSNEVVYHTGEVNWVPPGIFRASCKMDITYFPFDEQTCYLKFGSWTYHGHALDLHISREDGESDGMDLSTYTPSGEWHLIKAPAIREVTYTACCPEPYSTVTFYMVLRRRTIFYLFNIVLPSLLVSVMTLMGFCLPAHDMSEKIGYQTTILLSLCFFVTIVSDATPPTSEAVPLLGMFFSTLTLLVSVSTAFTITVLNIRYRQPHNCNMSPTFYKLFLEWIPWFLMMKRPGMHYKKRRAAPVTNFLVSMESLDCQGTSQCECTCRSVDSYSLPPRKDNPLLRKLHSIPTERLHLERKVGSGIFRSSRRMRKGQSSKSTKRMTQVEKYIQKCMEDVRTSNSSNNAYILRVVTYYQHILNRLKHIREHFDEKEKIKMDQEDWKYAALVLDRFCLVLFTLFMTVCLTAIILSTPHFHP